MQKWKSAAFFYRLPLIIDCCSVIGCIASLTAPDGQEFHFPFFPPQISIIFTLFFFLKHSSILSSIWPSGPGYSTECNQGRRPTSAFAYYLPHTRMACVQPLYSIHVHKKQPFFKSFSKSSIVGFFIFVSTCILERVFSHLEGMCSDCK